jgi:large subunit ribosomal protein L28
MMLSRSFLNFAHKVVGHSTATASPVTVRMVSVVTSWKQPSGFGSGGTASTGIQLDNNKNRLTSSATTTTTTAEQRRYGSNRARRGLYDGKDVRSGNSLSFSMKSTKRKFKPNVFIKRVYSEILNEMVRFHLTTSALRSIDKMGGLDNYLLSSPHVTSGEGLEVKKRIINRLKYHQRMEERAKKEDHEDGTGSITTA